MLNHIYQRIIELFELKLRKLRDLSFNEGDQGINGDVRQNKPNRLVIQ